MKIKPVNINKIDNNEVLLCARITYGNKNQVLVCIEELNELACVLSKFNRYDDEGQARKELHDKALDELADVYIVLEHVKSILGIPNEEIMSRAKLKIERLKRWLSKSKSMQETIDDREVENECDCNDCLNKDKGDNTTCKLCLSEEAVSGIKPYYHKYIL